jgi:hypothetical protein
MAVAVLGTMFLTACGGDTFEEKVSSVNVTSAITVIPVMGGTATINVTGDGISATSSADWLTVSVEGNTINLQAAGNSSNQSRNALVNISAANGDKTFVNISQQGMVIRIVADNSYVFEGEDNADALIVNNSNVDFETVVSADWIKFEKNAQGYTLNVADNEGDELRSGSVTLKYGTFIRKIDVLQWGKEYPFLQMNTATFKDKTGTERSKAITIEKDTDKENQYLIKGLVPEGDVLLMYNKTEKNWYVSSGYYVGPMVKTDDTQVYLRCMMSAANADTGARYIPTTITTTATSAYRMQFSWNLNDDNQTELIYTRNSTLSSIYTTNGIIVVRYKKQSGAAVTNRDGSDDDCIEYYMLDLKFSKK